MKKRILCWLLCLAMLIPGLALTARADCAPKPTTYVRVTPGGGERVLVTLLADKEGRGPNADCTETDFSDGERAERAFARYAVENGLHFWGQTWQYDVDWRYHPPERFRVAVYYPDYDVLLVSSEWFERYAFHADYRVNLPRLTEDTQSGTIDMVVLRDTDWLEDAWNLLVRIGLTLLVECFAACFWGYVGRGQLPCILRVNLLTQTALNVLLWLWYYLDGPMDAMVRLLMAEILVVALESWLYLRKLPNRGSGFKTVSYTLAANLASAVAGFFLL